MNNLKEKLLSEHKKLLQIQTSGKIFSIEIIQEKSLRLKSYLNNYEKNFTDELISLDKNLSNQRCSIGLLIYNLKHTNLHLSNLFENIKENEVVVEYFKNKIKHFKTHLEIVDEEFKLTKEERDSIIDTEFAKERLNTLDKEKQNLIQNVKQSEIDIGFKRSNVEQFQKEMNSIKDVDYTTDILVIKSELDHLINEEKKIEETKYNLPYKNACLILDSPYSDSRKQKKLEVYIVKYSHYKFYTHTKLMLENKITNAIEDGFSDLFILIKENYDKIDIDLIEIDNQLKKNITLHLKVNPKVLGKIDIPNNLTYIKVKRSTCNEASLKTILNDIDEYEASLPDEDLIKLKNQIEQKRAELETLEKKQKENEEYKIGIKNELNLFDKSLNVLENEKLTNIESIKNIQNEIDLVKSKLESKEEEKSKIDVRVKSENEKIKRNQEIEHFLNEMNKFEMFLNIIETRNEYLNQLLTALHSAVFSQDYHDLFQELKEFAELNWTFETKNNYFF